MTDIEKVFTFEYKGYLVTIKRNTRKDCFLSATKLNPEPYESPDIYFCNGSRFHLTVKNAKYTAIKAIDFFTK